MTAMDAPSEAPAASPSAGGTATASFASSTTHASALSAAANVAGAAAGAATVAAEMLAPIPTTLKSSFQSWWSATPAAAAVVEARLAARSGFFDPSEPHPSGKVGTLGPVYLRPNPKNLLPWSGGEERQINTLEIGTPETPAEGETNIVLTHGYGAAQMFFFQNIAALASIPHSRLFAIDWLGMGRSSRVPFKVRAPANDVRARVEEAEDFFVNSLEEWRERKGIEKMVLIGHSLGAYLSTAYTLRHPTRVQQLILVSPAGVSRNPYEGSTDQAPVPKKTAMKEFQQSQTEVAPPPDDDEEMVLSADMDRLKAQKEAMKREPKLGGKALAARANGHDLAKARKQEEAAKDKGDDVDDEENAHKPPSKRMRTVFGWLWEQNVSPFSFVRNSFFYAPLLVGKYTSRRFGALEESALRDLHHYCYAIFSSRGSSEYCLAHLLAPGAYARLPLLDRVTELPKIPITFMYGEYDWMDERAGHESVKRLKASGNDDARCFRFPHAGHHLYLDNAPLFNKLIVSEITERLDKAKQERSRSTEPRDLPPKIDSLASAAPSPATAVAVS